MMQEFRRDLLTEFAGLPVYEFCFAEREELAQGDVPEDVENWAWRIALDDAESEAGGFAQVLELFLDSVDTTRVRALILGYWLVDYDVEIDSTTATGPLIEHAKSFPALEALFVGDMHAEQAEVSWLYQSDPGPVLAAFPALRTFGLRGTTNLTLAPFEHAALEELTFQGGGLPPAVVQAIGASTLPALCTLELYLGDRWYGGGATGEDAEVTRLLRGESEPVDMYRVEGTRAWYEGFVAALEKLQIEIEAAGATPLASTEETAIAFDEARTTRGSSTSLRGSRDWQAPGITRRASAAWASSTRRTRSARCSPRCSPNRTGRPRPA